MWQGISRNTARISVAMAALLSQPALAQTLTGVGAVYDPVSLNIDGPAMDERSGDNPFSDVRMDVVFSQGKKIWTVPGYFAGCKDAADSSCTGGKFWQAHFLPPMAGDYQWQVKFRSGKDVVFEEFGGTKLTGDGAKGNFSVAATQRDSIRARGVVHYTGERYYRFSGDNSLFFKIGPDAPENTLAFEGFDATPNFKNLRKNWAPHLTDYNAKESKPYLWGKGKKGQALLGAFQYLADQKLNSVSMLLWNTGGDDRNVFPHLLAVDPSEYEKMAPADQWAKGVLQDRFDLSKLAQWQRALSYADSLGLHLHFKLQETENDKFMDGGALGRTRKLYMREMVARFGHFRAITWNLGEENVQTPGDVAHMSHYLDALDAYDRPIVLHSYPEQKERYRPYLGEGSALTGLSLQSHRETARDDMIEWRTASDLAGRAWTLGYDEQGRAQDGTGVDADYPDAKLPSARKAGIPQAVVRREIIWNAFTGGAHGAELYYGYQTGCTDLDCQDHRTRASLWKDGVIARDFFQSHVGEAALTMRALDHLSPAGDDYVFADPDKLFVIVKGEKASGLKLPGQEGRYSVNWFDRALGGALQAGSVAEIAGGEKLVELGNPPAGGSGEWVALVRRMADEEIMIEAESFVAQRNDTMRRWYSVNAASGATPTPDPDGKHIPGASGGAYVEVLPDTRTTHDEKLVRGENFTEDAGSMAVLSYDVNFPAAGRYLVWTRIHATGTEDNGIHVGLNGDWPESGRRIQFCPGKDQWYWDSRQRTEGQHCGVLGGIWLDVPSAGKHRVEFAMREDGVEFDAFYLTRSASPPTWVGSKNAKAAPKKKAADH